MVGWQIWDMGGWGNSHSYHSMLGVSAWLFWLGVESVEDNTRPTKSEHLATQVSLF